MALVAISSGRPLSATRKSAEKVMRPGGAISRWQTLPKLSRYSRVGVQGETCRVCGVMRSGKRSGLTLNIRIIGVGA